MTHDMKYIISISDSEAIIWQTFTGKSFQKLYGCFGCLDISPNGKYVALGADSAIKLQDIKTGNILKKFNRPPSDLLSLGDLKIKKNLLEKLRTISKTAIKITLDGQFIICGYKSGEILIWNINTGRLLKKFNGHTNSITDIHINLDGKYIASSSASYLIKFLDGKLVASRRTESIKLWNSNTLKVLKEFKLEDEFNPESICITPDEKYIIAGGGRRYRGLFYNNMGNKKQK